MSEYNFTMYVGPVDDRALTKIPSLLKLLRLNDFKEIKCEYQDFAANNDAEFFGSPLSDGGTFFTDGDTELSEVEGGSICFEFVCGTSFDYRLFVDKIRSLEECELECELRSADHGMAVFYKNGIWDDSEEWESIEDSVDWIWIEDEDEMPDF